MDIVERLRAGPRGRHDPEIHGIMLEAAAEIDRLTKENRELKSLVAQYELLVIPDCGGKVEDGSG